MPRNSTVTNQVRSTTNYDQFDYLTANRDVNRRHVEALVKSIEENGNFTEAQPILVNERMQLIDGQHRFEACKALGIPVYYTMVAGLRVDEARQMNLMHRRWQADDFLHSYTEEGRRPYLLLKQLREENPDLAMTTLILYALGYYASGYNSKFRNGELDMFNLDEARERIAKLNEVQKLSDAFNIKSMQLAFLTTMNASEYNHERMVRKITQNAADIRAFQNVGDNLRQLENVYNDGFSANRTRLF